ncbi:MAG TPA: N-methyl-L-tryptophan oxidase, partial [Gemmatimonadaceae bacterium]|nr:N-methyl-L-tryptophan oxidase [Gemmatimonadaceae bacterium]
SSAGSSEIAAITGTAPARGHRSYDVIVLGLGAMGRATLYHLAQRGRRVLGLEQHASGHKLGSSHGDSRIIREMYFEHPLYVPLVQRAYHLWRELETRSNRALMAITGGLMIGPAKGSVVTGTLKSAAEHGLSHEVLNARQTSERFTAFRFDDDLVAVLDPRAGYLDADACNAAHLDLALAAGADARFEEPVKRWNAKESGVELETQLGTYYADQLVIAAGGWTGKVLPDLGLPLSVERQTVFWLDPPAKAEQYDRSRFPIYAYEYKPGSICYGFPRLARGVKASVMHDGETTDDPAKVRRTIDEADVRSLRAALGPVLPSLASAPVRESDTCIFTNTPDHDFVIDLHPLHPQVLISSPCSGHGFKFASAVGELQAQLLIDGKTRFDLSPFRIGRFS